MFRGMWNLPGLGTGPVFPEFAGGFLTTASLGKSLDQMFYGPDVLLILDRAKCLARELYTLEIMSTNP